ncbi:MAG: DUF58 domain-containing protein [Oscillospiraceae bacterium]|nr:MAG: DUF58 domain-containing protein [Oscillospiraceae bacterium]
MFARDGFSAVLCAFAWITAVTCLFQLAASGIHIRPVCSMTKGDIQRGGEFCISFDTRRRAASAYPIVILKYSCASKECTNEQTSNYVFLERSEKKLSYKMPVDYVGGFRMCVQGIYVCDILGLFVRRIRPRGDLLCEFTVLPQRRRLSAENYERKACAISPDGEFDGVRKYIRGDSASAVDWKTTARRREMYVRNYSAAGDIPTICFMPASPQNGEERTLAAELVCLAAYEFEKSGGHAFRVAADSWVKNYDASDYSELLRDLAAAVNAEYRARCDKREARAGHRQSAEDGAKEGRGVYGGAVCMEILNSEGWANAVAVLPGEIAGTVCEGGKTVYSYGDTPVRNAALCVRSLEEWDSETVKQESADGR